MQAIILAGGFGTRLQSIISHVPKPMAPIAGKPFLDFLLQYLSAQNFTSIIFALHYQYEVIQSYYEASHFNLSFSFAIEPAPLGTGGAILHALSHVDHTKAVFVINGDTFVKLDYRHMYQQHENNAADFTMVLREVADCSRYGRVLTEENKVRAFKEKGIADSGLINAGVYLFSPFWFNQWNFPEVFSLENDFLLPKINQIQPQFVMAENYFIDIGVPEDYHRAMKELPLLEQQDFV